MKNNKIHCSAPPSKLSNQKNEQPYDNAAVTQRARILKHFECAAQLTTMQARDVYGILHPCGRVMELRKQGHLILTHGIFSPDANGVSHRIGMYVYCGKDNLVNPPWEKIIRLLPNDSGYNEMNLDHRFNYLKKFISKDLSTDNYTLAIKSLCEFLNY